MGWLSDKPGHQGHPAAIVQDGTSTATSPQAVAPPVTGWRSTCECGWTGKTFYPARPSDEGLCPDEIEEAAEAEWRNHMAPLEGVDSVARSAQASLQAGEQLDHAVRSARAAGASWAAIGAAVGISRQAAHERWSTTVKSPRQIVSCKDRNPCA